MPFARILQILKFTHVIVLFRIVKLPLHFGTGNILNFCPHIILDMPLGNKVSHCHVCFFPSFIVVCSTKPNQLSHLPINFLLSFCPYFMSFCNQTSYLFDLLFHVWCVLCRRCWMGQINHIDVYVIWDTSYRSTRWNTMLSLTICSLYITSRHFFKVIQL